jgi:dephospho-CoA kinase
VPPPFVALTGAIAAGKSEALAAFTKLGAATLSSDALVHELLADERVREGLIERWGDEIAPAGVLDRGRVGAIVFERPAELAWLESVLHTLVGERVAEWRAALPPETPLAVVEVPLLFETGMEDACDATVSVVADDAVRAARAGDRGTDLFEGRSARQLSQEEKAARATYVVRNDGTVAELESRLRSLMDELVAATPEGR